MRSLSNYQHEAADTIGQLVVDADKALAASIEKSLEAGHLLILAKAECQHGQWLPFLTRAGIPERKAQRLMTLSRSGLESDTVSELGGVTGALRFLAERRLPEPGEGLSVTACNETGLVWPSALYPGLYFVACASAGDEARVHHTRRPVHAGEAWDFVDAYIVSAKSTWRFRCVNGEDLAGVALDDLDIAHIIEQGREAARASMHLADAASADDAIGSLYGNIYRA